MSNSDAKSPAELEDVAATFIGRVALVLSRLEFNVGLYLRNAVGGSDPEGVNPLLARLSFKSKIDALQEVVDHKFAQETTASAEFGQWLKAMDAFRPKRNSFVHGRWTFAFRSQEIVNVVPGLPSGKPQREVRYSTAELQIVLREAERLAAGFDAWSRHWPA